MFIGLNKKKISKKVWHTSAQQATRIESFIYAAQKYYV